MNIGRPDTARYKSGKQRKSGSKAPSMRAGWFADDRLGVSGTVPRAKPKKLCGKVAKDCVSRYHVLWMRSGASLDVIRISLASDSGAERFAAQQWLKAHSANGVYDAKA